MILISVISNSIKQEEDKKRREKRQKKLQKIQKQQKTQKSSMDIDFTSPLVVDEIKKQISKPDDKPENKKEDNDVKMKETKK